LGTAGSIRRTGPPTALSFPDTRHGWVVGPRGYIIHYHIVEVVVEGSGDEPTEVIE
jgi:hypothetical protein